MSALLMKKDEEHLIQEKIAVPDAFPRVSRLRLLKLLAENVVCCNATIVNGRAGTGKTTLAADFAPAELHRCPRQSTMLFVSGSRRRVAPAGGIWSLHA